MKQTIGQVLETLRKRHGLRMTDLAEVLNVSPHLLSKISRDQKELSFLMALRLLKRFDLSVEDFAAMLSEKELNRTDLSTIRYFEKQELREARFKQVKPIEARIAVKN